MLRQGRCTSGHTRVQQLCSLNRSYFTPPFQRNPNYAKVNDHDLSFFQSVLGTSGVITSKTDTALVQGYNTDWMNKFKGNGGVVLRPKTTQQVSQVLKYCNEKKLAVVPQGGNTGLVGGSVPVFDELVLSTSLMGSIMNFDEISGIVTCQSGVILQQLQSYLEERNHIVPLDLGAKGSCQIGGNVSTNAGGLRLLRYGSLHGSVLGLEVVLADGTILDLLTHLRKDNTGYDLKQLFIGAEGTLGVVTAVSLLTPPKPQSVNVAFLGCNSFESVRQIYRHAKLHLAEILSAVEFLDRRSLDMVVKHIANSRDPFANSYPFYVLIETSGSNKQHDEAKLNFLLEKLMSEEQALVSDGTVAQDLSQTVSLWKLREAISESLQRAGTVYKYDVSIPLEYFYELVDIMTERIGNKGIVVGYGHIGDGNLHLNVSTPKFDPEVLNLIEPFVYEYTSSKRGSISAEHGLGVMKADHLHYSKSQPAIDIMRMLKSQFDPNHILNPYKVIPHNNVH